MGREERQSSFGVGLALGSVLGSVIMAGAALYGEKELFGDYMPKLQPGKTLETKCANPENIQLKLEDIDKDGDLDFYLEYGPKHSIIGNSTYMILTEPKTYDMMGQIETTRPVLKEFTVKPGKIVYKNNEKKK